MLAPRDQLVRWQGLLTGPCAPSPQTADELATVLTRTQGRPRMVAALNALELARVDASARTRLAVALPPASGAAPLRRPAIEGLAVADAVLAEYVRTTLSPDPQPSWLPEMIASLAPTALVFTSDDNPEPWWHAEMMILHALHSYALRQSHVDRSMLDRTLACADFHLREIQPDHATNEPWAVHAYASHTDGNVTAETLWHAAHIQHGGHPGPVAALLARDAAFSLQAWLERTASA